MKILMLVNWKIEYCQTEPSDKQPPDYCAEGKPYWFFCHFSEQPQVDVIDISSWKWLEKFEKRGLHFYVVQALKALPKLKKYDLVLSHGMQSGVVISLCRRLFRTKAKHIVFDIGSFASASERGFALKLMQYASKSLDGLIYHTSSQIEYYKKFFPWLVKKSKFVRFGTDPVFFSPTRCRKSEEADTYILCIGYERRDKETLVSAYRRIRSDVKLRMVGAVCEEYEGVEGIEQIPPVSIRTLMDQIANALFCVLPLQSFNYSYGQMTLLQQMALEKAVIAARVPSFTDYVTDGKTALLYEPENVADLAEKMKILLEDKTLRDCLARSAREDLLRNCNEKIMAEEIEEFCREVLMLPPMTGDVP